MSETNLQTWKVPFIAEIWKDDYTHAVIDESCKIKLDEFTIFLEPIKKEKISGSFLVQFSNSDNSVNSAEAMAEQIKQNEFENFKRILLLKGLDLEVKWGKIEAVNLPKNHRLTVSSSLTSSYKIIKSPIPFLKKDIQSIEVIHDKIQNHDHKEYINNIMNLLTTKTSNMRERFFYKWVAFNQIYSYDADDDDSERMSIENFATKYSEFLESPQQIQNNKEIFTVLSNDDHFNKKKTENFSIKLREAINNENNFGIWKYSFLCVYSIRNEFFHGGEENKEFDKLSKFLDNIVLTALNNIFGLK